MSIFNNQINTQYSVGYIGKKGLGVNEYEFQWSTTDILKHMHLDENETGSFI